MAMYLLPYMIRMDLSADLPASCPTESIFCWRHKHTAYYTPSGTNTPAPGLPVLMFRMATECLMRREL